MLATGVTYVIAIAVALVMAFLLRDTEDARVSYRFAIAFGNCGFIGLPVVGAILGAEAVLYAAISLIPANVILFAVGPLFFIDATADAGRPADRLRGVLASLKTPTLAASVAVLVLALAGVKPAGSCGSSARQSWGRWPLRSPCSSPVHRWRITDRSRCSATRAPTWLPQAVFSSCPSRALIAVNLFPLSAFLRAVIVLDGAMPVATLGALYCLKSGRDTKPMMQVDVSLGCVLGGDDPARIAGAVGRGKPRALAPAPCRIHDLLRIPEVSMSSVGGWASLSETRRVFSPNEG